MKKIHKILLLVLGILTLVLIESNPEYSTGTFKMIRKKVEWITVAIFTDPGNAPLQLQNLSSTLN